MHYQFRRRSVKSRSLPVPLSSSNRIDRDESPPRDPLSPLVLSALLFLFGSATGHAAEPFELKPGDHICIIGNTLADRMQHDGWLETYLHSRFPKHDLVFRNLGFSGDELTVRLRSADFGTPRRVADRRPRPTSSSPSSATTNRSPARRGSTSSRRTSTPSSSTRSARSTTARAAPRLVLFSPIAHEDLHDRNLPDGTREQRAARALHRGDGRGRQGQRRPLRRPVPARRRSCTRKADAAADDQRHPPERARQPAARARSSTRPCSPASRAASATRRRWRSSARPSSTRTSTGSTAIAPSTATRSTAAGPT